MKLKSQIATNFLSFVTEVVMIKFSCHDKIFASTCQSKQKELERELKTSRQENMKKRSRMGNSTRSTEKPRKIPHSMVTSARKGLPFGNQ